VRTDGACALLTASGQDEALRAAKRANAARIADDHRTAMRIKMTRHVSMGVMGVLAAVSAFVVLQEFASPDTRLWWLASSAVLVTAGMREFVDLIDLVVGDTPMPLPTKRTLTAIDRAVGATMVRLSRPLAPPSTSRDRDAVRVVPMAGGA
jgi:hypothetical protein